MKTIGEPDNGLDASSECGEYMQKLNRKGFTIIEILVVIVILGILAAIAIPRYGVHVTNSRRADGKTALVEAAQILERYFTNNHEYGEIDAGNYVGATTIPAESENGYYAISVTAADATSFTIQATAQNQQANDTACQNMTINQLGQKTPAACW